MFDKILIEHYDYECFLWNLVQQDIIIKIMLLNILKSFDDKQNRCLQGNGPSIKGHSTGMVSQVFDFLW